MRLLWLCTIGSFFLSMCAKWLADAFLVDRVALLGSFAGLQYATNPGIAFGLRLPDALQLPIILLALGLILFAAMREDTTMGGSIGFGLIIGGALGNILDRLYDGVVTDFFQIGAFPIFNLADSFITVGAVFLLAESMGLIGNTLKKRG